MKRFVFIPFFMLSLLLVTTSCNEQASKQASFTATSTPTSTGLTSQAAPGAISNVATDYYQAITKRNYKLAYTYLDPAATRFSLTAFTQEAQSRDKQEGVLQSYSVAAFPPMVVMTNMRVHIGPYHVHLEFKQEGSRWKIVSLDGI